MNPVHDMIRGGTPLVEEIRRDFFDPMYKSDTDELALVQFDIIARYYLKYEYKGFFSFVLLCL